MSSVIVSGMEMPKNCYECDFCSGLHCGRTGFYVTSDFSPKRNPDCPLRPSPSEHGELIDRDKLLHDIEHYHLSDGKFQHWVEVQPVIVPAERKDT